MSDPIICPDCGGVIGAGAGDDVKVCQCGSNAYHPTDQQVAIAEATVQAVRDATPAVEKFCRICRRNLAGHRRLKDANGYICVVCAKDERDAKLAGMVACIECGKKLKPAGLIDYHGTKICKRCYADHIEVSRFKAPPPKLDQHDKQEKKRLYILLIIMGVLGSIVLLSQLGILGAKP